MSAITYLTDERDWSRALDEAKSLETLRAVVAGWAPFVSDAQAVVDAMAGSDFERWRVGRAGERRGEFAGEHWMEEFGALLLPERLMRASVVARNMAVPLGCALIRMSEAKA